MDWTLHLHFETARTMAKPRVQHLIMNDRYDAPAHTRTHTPPLPLDQWMEPNHFFFRVAFAVDHV